MLAPFAHAISRVKEWLANEGAAFVQPAAKFSAREGLAWDVDLGPESLPVQAFRLVLPPTFPADPCEIRVDPKHCLQLPHIEGNGKACLNLAPSPDHYAEPVAAVKQAIEGFGRLIRPALEDDSVQDEFHQERLSYWTRFCERRAGMRDAKPAPQTTYVALGEVKTWESGQIAAFIRAGSKHRRFNLQVITGGDRDPHTLATRHRWDAGTMVRGHSLIVRLSEETRWTPATWPKDFEELEALTFQATSGETSLSTWLATTGWLAPTETKPKGKWAKDAHEEPPHGPQPLAVVLMHGTELYGFQILPQLVSHLTLPTIVPIQLSRVDASWCLTRDQEHSRFIARQSKRVLVLGCGSLGSPLVDVLARAGVGHIDIVDQEGFDAANTSRHVLGLSDLKRGKATAMAARLTEAIPTVSVNGYVATASGWLTKAQGEASYDLIVDCTAESSVRVLLAQLRTESLGTCPVVHAWVEPFCGAAHVVCTQADEPWPLDDPAESMVNVAEYRAQTRVDLPACSYGFHPYGAADILQAAGFAAERVLWTLDHPDRPSVVWSWVRSQAFFDSVGTGHATRSLVPKNGTVHDAVMLTRSLGSVLVER